MIRTTQNLLCDNWILIGFPADEAFKGYIFFVTAYLVVLIIYIKTVLLRKYWFNALVHKEGFIAFQLTISSISPLVQFSLNLPAMFVVWSVMKKLAAIWWQERKTWWNRMVKMFKWEVLVCCSMTDWSHTHLQNHRNQSPYNLCRYQAGSPTWRWLSDVQGLGLVLFCYKD